MNHVDSWKSTCEAVIDKAEQATNMSTAELKVSSGLSYILRILNPQSQTLFLVHSKCSSGCWINA